MALVSSSTDAKFVEGFLNDLRNLSNEARKRHNAVKEASETAIIRLRNLSQNDRDMRERIISHCLDLLQPILLAVESGNSKLIIMGLQTLQRLFAHEAVAEASFPVVLNCFWSMMEHRVEELKLIQTITMILTSSNSLHGDHLAKVLVICLRMHFSKDPVVNSTAGAAIRQLVPLLFEKALEESRLELHTRTSDRSTSNGRSTPSSPRSRSSKAAPPSLSPCAADAYALLQDLCLVMSGEQPSWLVGITDMTRVLALQLIESVLSGYRDLFNINEFSTLLRERLCPLLIKLLSPCTRTTKSATTSTKNATADMPSFAVTVNLVRNVYVILTTYEDLLRPETEVFYSLLNKFVDSERLPWLRILGLEVYYRLFSDPKVVMLISQTYSTKAASEGVFGNILSTMNNYILGVFVKPSAAPAPPTPQTPAGSPMNTSPTFTHRDVTIQLTPVGKPILLESRDADAPSVSDNYGMALAFSTVCFISKTLAELLEKLSADSAYKDKVWNLVQNSWCGVLAASGILLEASCDESVTDTLLNVSRIYVKASGTVNMDMAREAFIIALCKAAFPINYTIGILKSASSRLAAHSASASVGLDRRFFVEQPGGGQEGQNRNQIVAVGTSLSTAYQGSVMLTAKNITCLNSLLDITENMGEILHGSWILVLASLQHLAWILGINQHSPGLANTLSRQRSKAAVPETSQNTILTNVLMSDLPELTKRFDELFRRTSRLTDAALEHVVHALCKLSLDALDIAASTREPSVFAIAKLFDVSLVNMFRIETWWTVVTGNLLEVCANSNQVLREWGTDALSILTKEAVEYDFKPPLATNTDLQEKILHPLIGLSRVPWPDVRLKQFSCVHLVIQGSAEKVGSCWKPMLQVIGFIDGIADEALIRAGFKCLQAIVSDHLRDLPVPCLELCADAAAKYGSQALEVNVSLTAIGILWNIADYSCQNKGIFGTDLDRLQQFVISLFKQLSQLCLDIRPEVRKSAAQTLFLAVISHGSVLDHGSWQRLLADICYTLLKCLDKYCSTASDERLADERDEKLMIHHSRDTARKQWAETWAMLLPSITKIVLANLHVVQRLKQPLGIWQGLLTHIQSAGLYAVEEVSTSALRCLEEILSYPETPKSDGQSVEISKAMWEEVWKTYIHIGIGTIDSMRRTTNIDDLRSQKWLALYVSLFSRIHGRLGEQFGLEMVRRMHLVFPHILIPPLSSKTASKLLPCKAEVSPLQEAVLAIVDSIEKEILKPRSSCPHLIPELYTLWQNYCKFSTSSPVILKALNAASDTVYVQKWWRTTFSLFSENAMQRLCELYRQTFAWKLVMDSDTLSNIIQALHQPLKLRETDAHQTAWRSAVGSLLTVIKLTIPNINAQTRPVYRNIWISLARAFDDFLYGQDNSLLEWGTDQVDCEVATFVRSSILPLIGHVPPDDLKFVIMIFDRGSLHNVVLDHDQSLPEGAESFSTICFESLLEFTLFYSLDLTDEGILDIPSLLLRCEKLLSGLTSGALEAAVARARIALRCVESVLKIIKPAAVTQVDRHVWHDVIALYPKLVALVQLSVSEPEQRTAGSFYELLHCALLQYSSLIQPPFKL